MRIVEATTISITQYTFVLPLAEALQSRGDQVTLACSDERREEGSSFVQELAGRGFDVVIVPMSRRISPIRDCMAIGSFYRYFRTHPTDLLHTQTAKAGMIARIAARLARVPRIVYTAHAFPFHDYLPAWRRYLYAVLERFASHLCDVIVVDSKSVKSQGVKYGISEGKIRVIPMGIDTKRFSPVVREELRTSARLSLEIPESATVIGLAARFVPDKGLETFIDAARDIAARCHEVFFLMVGDGPLRQDLERRIELHGLSRLFRLPGMQARMEPYYAAMDVFMLPTLREGFGVAFCEAMSMQIPAVATRIEPLTDIVIDGETGYLAEPRDVDGFAAAAERLVRSKDMRQRLGAAGRRLVIEEFSVEKMVREHQILFDRLTAA